MRQIKFTEKTMFCMALCCITALGAEELYGQDALEMPAIFSDNMVLQRSIPVPVWGAAAPMTSISVKFKGQEKSTVAGADGRWMIRLEPMEASSEPCELIVSSSNDNPQWKFKNVLVGEVWICSGQSNMGANFAENPDELAALESIPEIRVVGGLGKIVPLPDKHVFPYSQWEMSNPASLNRFSRVGYYFGLELWKALQVPIGLVNVSLGCSSIDAWMPPESFSANKDWTANLDEMVKTQNFYRGYDNCSAEEKERVFLEHCNGKYGFARHFLKDGKPDVEQYAGIFSHMLAVKPACLFNHAIRPIIPFGIRGTVWYQGETEEGTRDVQYAEKQHELIEGWRKLWGEGDFPFYIVQVAPFKAYGWLPNLWLQQYRAVKETRNTGIASTVDISDINEVHPKDKRFIGHRLALLALRDTYNMNDLVASGPTYKAMSVNGTKVVIAFDNLGTGLTTRDGKPPDWFEVAGTDKKFVNAEAAIDGNTVVVSSPAVSPAYVRYAWNGSAEPNLRNKEGLPALPFNTAEPFFQSIK